MVNNCFVTLASTEGMCQAEMVWSESCIRLSINVYLTKYMGNITRDWCSHRGHTDSVMNGRVKMNLTSPFLKLVVCIETSFPKSKILKDLEGLTCNKRLLCSVSRLTDSPPSACRSC